MQSRIYKVLSLFADAANDKTSLVSPQAMWVASSFNSHRSVKTFPESIQHTHRINWLFAHVFAARAPSPEYPSCSLHCGSHLLSKTDGPLTRTTSLIPKLKLWLRRSQLTWEPSHAEDGAGDRTRTRTHLAGGCASLTMQRAQMALKISGWFVNLNGVWKQKLLKLWFEQLRPPNSVNTLLVTSLSRGLGRGCRNILVTQPCNSIKYDSQSIQDSNAQCINLFDGFQAEINHVANTSTRACRHFAVPSSDEGTACFSGDWSPIGVAAVCDPCSTCVFTPPAKWLVTKILRGLTSVTPDTTMVFTNH